MNLHIDYYRNGMIKRIRLDSDGTTDKDVPAVVRWATEQTQQYSPPNERKDDSDDDETP